MRQANNIKEGLDLFIAAFRFWMDAIRPNTILGICFEKKGMTNKLFWLAVSGVDNFDDSY